MLTYFLQNGQSFFLSIPLVFVGIGNIPEVILQNAAELAVLGRFNCRRNGLIPVKWLHTTLTRRRQVELGKAKLRFQQLPSGTQPQILSFDNVLNWCVLRLIKMRAGNGKDRNFILPTLCCNPAKDSNSMGCTFLKREGTKMYSQRIPSKLQFRFNFQVSDYKIY